MKKICSIILFITLSYCFSFISSAEDYKVQQASTSVSISSSNVSVSDADVKISKDTAKKIALKALKDYMNVEIDEKKFQVSMQLDQSYGLNQGKRWNISFNQSDIETSYFISVSIDADKGKVVSMNNYKNVMRSQNKKIALVSEEQAKITAKDFLDKINKEEIKLCKQEDDIYNRYRLANSSVHNFNYIRYANGIKFDGNYINVSVDGVTGKINSYQFMWNDLKIPAIVKTIDKQKASEIFEKNTNMNLSYIPFRKNNEYSAKVKTVKLVYSPEFPNGYIIDSKDGKLIDSNGKVFTDSRTKDLSDQERNEFLKKEKPLTKSKIELDESHATEILKANISELFGEGYIIDSIRYSNDGNNQGSSYENMWSANFYKKDSDSINMGGSQISIDALSGRLSNIYIFGYNPTYDNKFTPKLTWEEAYSKALDVISKCFPDKLKEIQTKQTYVKNNYIYNGVDVSDRNFRFSFNRLVNGIPYTNDNISIAFDAKTGDLTELRYFWDDSLSFTDTKEALSIANSKSIFLKENVAELMYTVINNSEEPSIEDLKIQSVYKLQMKGNQNSIYMPASFIDAFSGKLLDYNGEEVLIKIDDFAKVIKGNWAEKQLSILGANGIIDKENFKPDKAITKFEAIKLIAKASGYTVYMPNNLADLKFSDIKKDNENYLYVQIAVKLGVLNNTTTKFNGNDKVSRTDMAELLVKLCKYDKLSKANNIFQIPFSDCKGLSVEKINYISIAKGLGICSGKDGKYRPNDNATMTEFAASVYNSLGYIN